MMALSDKIEARKKAAREAFARYREGLPPGDAGDGPGNPLHKWAAELFQIYEEHN